MGARKDRKKAVTTYKKERQAGASKKAAIDAALEAAGLPKPRKKPAGKGK